MKRTGVFALMISLALLTGCGSHAQEAKYNEFSQRLTASQGLSFTGKVRAEYEDKTEEYTLNFAENAEDCTVEVTEPELIAGIKAHIEGDSTALEYDGAKIDTGALPGGATPISALPELVKAMKTGHLDMAWSEGEATAAQITPEDNQTVTVWFDENMIPYHAEIQSSGKVIIYCDILSFNLT